MRRYQIYAVDSAGGLVWAGAEDIPRMTRRAAERIQAAWRSWATAYVADHPGDYPLAERLRAGVRVVAFRFHLIGRAGVRVVAFRFHLIGRAVVKEISVREQIKEDCA